MRLIIDTDGVARIAKTRVTLDTVILAFEQGATAEEIAYRYPILKLSDVYSAIGFYLNHQDDVAIYLQQRQQQAKEIRILNEQKFNPKTLHARLLARRSEKISVCILDTTDLEPEGRKAMPVELEERVALLEAEVERLKHQLPSVNLKTEHPMLKFTGIFKEDPDFAAVVANIAADRAAKTEN